MTCVPNMILNIIALGCTVWRLKSKYFLNRARVALRAQARPPLHAGSAGPVGSALAVQVPTGGLNIPCRELAPSRSHPQHQRRRRVNRKLRRSCKRGRRGTGGGRPLHVGPADAAGSLLDRRRYSTGSGALRQRHAHEATLSGWQNLRACGKCGIM